MTNFVAYIDLCIPISTSLFLIGGTYNFEIRKSDDITLNDVAIKKPYVGATIIVSGRPYLLMLISTQSPIDQLHDCTLRIKQAGTSISWRNICAPSPLTGAFGEENFKSMSQENKAEVHEMMNQYLKLFPDVNPDIFTLYR